MKKIVTALLILIYLLLPGNLTAYECVETNSGMSPQDLQGIQQACLETLNNNKNEQKTLKQAISSINTKVILAQAQINQTISQINTLEKEITVLSGVLETVNRSMDDLGKIYQARVRESYRRSRVTSIDMVFSTQSFGDFLTKLKYLNTIKTKDQLILSELENSRLDYDQRKNDKITKQEEIEKLKSKLISQKKVLDAQISEKQNLLSLTQNDEKKYQALLAKVRAELEAIESIIAGKGTETFVRDISPGEQVASVIPGSSACSTGGHLHFEVVNSGSHQNPAAYLGQKEITWDNSPDGPISFTGSWPWPLEDKIRITQGYGHTAFSSRYSGDIHTGLDMVNTGNYGVKAVRKGGLYRGSIACGGGTLKYVHVKHSEDSYDTFYLHVNYF
ncbi:MAG: hypothetical protein UW80_C0056G0003 [Microgenomates group bacterium GW2011_GWC1_44_9]|nr:MAG: hypothetical protein UW80_C0056G0003 [Microgenomates group bacterium GW2011_GWC1_44_9]